MSWGTELWDQLEKVSDHTLRGIEFTEKCSHYCKDRAKVESEYAAALRKLTKNYLPRKKEEESPFTVVKSFNDSLKEVNDIAGQHELLAEQLKTTILDEMTKLGVELKAERKRHMEKAKQLENQLQAQMRALEQSKRKYFRSYEEQTRAEETYRNADANLNLSRAEVEKTKNISHQRAQFCSDCKAGYALALEQTNAHQRDYYNKHLPQVFQSLQELDENRITKIQQSIKKMCDEEKGIQPIINTCLEGITTASQKIDHAEDSRKVIDRYKSGFFPPEDIAFEDLSTEDSHSVGSNHKISRENRETVKNSGGTSKSKTKKERSTLGKIFGGGRASEPEREDFGHLPPQQQKKQLKEKIKAIKHQITKERAEREGLVKMQEVYKGNPKLGDANSVSSQLEDNRHKMENLEAEMAKYEGYLAAAEGNGSTPVMARRSSGGSHHSSHSGESSTPAASTPTSAVNGSSATPNSSSTSQNPTPQRQTTSPTHDSFDNGSFDEEDMPIVGKATALYQFDATTSGSLSMVPDEELSIVDQDNGDGWTRIRKPTGEEGFVPTTYIKIH